MNKRTKCEEAREVALNYSSNAGYDIEIGYYFHHRRHNSNWYQGISKIFGWVSKHPICLKLCREASSQGRGALSVSPLSVSNRQALDDFSVYLENVLGQAFNGEPVKKLKRQSIVFYIRVSLQGREKYYRKVYWYTFDNYKDLIDQIPRVRNAFRRSIFIETSNDN